MLLAIPREHKGLVLPVPGIVYLPIKALGRANNRAPTPEKVANDEIDNCKHKTTKEGSSIELPITNPCSYHNLYCCPHVAIVFCSDFGGWGESTVKLFLKIHQYLCNPKRYAAARKLVLSGVPKEYSCLKNHQNLAIRPFLKFSLSPLLRIPSLQCAGRVRNRSSQTEMRLLKMERSSGRCMTINYKLKILNRQDNVEDGKTKSTQR